MCDPEFCRKARATDFLGRAWDVFLGAGSKDKVCYLDVKSISYTIITDTRAHLHFLCSSRCTRTRLSIRARIRFRFLRTYSV